MPLHLFFTSYYLYTATTTTEKKKKKKKKKKKVDLRKIKSGVNKVYERKKRTNSFLTMGKTAPLEPNRKITI